MESYHSHMEKSNQLMQKFAEAFKAQRRAILPLSSRNSQPRHIHAFIIALIVTSAVHFFLIYNAWTSYHYFKQLILLEPVLKIDGGSMLALDDVRTLSVRFSERMSDLQRELSWSLTITYATLPFIVLSWVLVFRWMKKYDKDRQLNEQQLEEDRHYLRMLIDAIPDEIAIKDVNRRFLLANSASIHALGQESADDVLGKRDEDLISENVAIDARLQEEQVISSGTPLLNIEGLEHIDLDNGQLKRAILISRIPLRGKDGAIAGLMVVNRDITERKRAEEALQSSETKLKETLLKNKLLSGLIPICASCKKIRDDQGYWNQLEKYIGEHSEAHFSHGICPTCAERLYPHTMKRINDKQKTE
jgi:PAS domain S-box-containing protein